MATLAGSSPDGSGHPQHLLLNTSGHLVASPANCNCGCLTCGCTAIPPAVNVAFQSTPDVPISITFGGPENNGIPTAERFIIDADAPDVWWNFVLEGASVTIPSLNTLLESRVVTCNRNQNPAGCTYIGRSPAFATLTVHPPAHSRGSSDPSPIQDPDYDVVCDLVVRVTIDASSSNQGVSVEAWLYSAIGPETNVANCFYGPFGIRVFNGFTNWSETLPRDCSTLSDDSSHQCINAGVGGLALVTAWTTLPQKGCIGLVECNPDGTVSVHFEPTSGLRDVMGRPVPAIDMTLVWVEGLGQEDDRIGFYTGTKTITTAVWNESVGAWQHIDTDLDVTLFCDLGRNVFLTMTSPVEGDGGGGGRIHTGVWCQRSPGTGHQCFYWTTDWLRVLWPDWITNPEYANVGFGALNFTPTVTIP